MEMYSKHNEGKSVVAGSFTRTLNNKIHKEMTSVSKNVYIDKLDNTVDQYNNMHHIYTDFDEKNNKEDSKSKFCDHIRILKYKNVFAKGYAPNRSTEVFVIRKVKNTIAWTYVISNLQVEEIVGKFYEK